MTFCCGWMGVSMLKVKKVEGDGMGWDEVMR